MDKNKNLTLKENFDLAIQYHKNNNFNDAQNYYQKVLKIDPNYINAHNNLGIIFKRLGDHEKAIDCFEKAIKINPNFAAAYSNLGNIFVVLEENQKAISYFEKSIEINPNHRDGLYNLGNLFLNTTEYKKAIDCFEKAIEIDTNHAGLQNNLGVSFLKLDEYTKALKCFQKAISINPNNHDTYNNLAISFGNLGEHQKAIDSFKKAKLINPNLDYEISIAESYLKNKDAKNALSFLETYLKKYPQDTRANAYKTIALRGLKKFDQIEELISFANLVKTIDLQILTSDNILEFNKELRSLLVNDPRRHPENNHRGWAIRGGTVIRNLLNTTNPSILKFEFFLKKAIDYYIDNLPNNDEHPFLMIKKKDYHINNSWVNFLEPGNFQANHIHDKGWISGVYYLDEPEIELDEKHAGWIEFNRAGYNLPHFAGEQGIELIKPKSGMFILFPSYTWHGTIPYKHKYNRISISFDINPSGV
ncbi:tetratricopeptide repeat protein [Pelagibacterales bacterium SAG-MED46]|nr:tetratricopeptide repeat protein [Pelagibacterales bacterium SAG-MED46]